MKVLLKENVAAEIAAVVKTVASAVIAQNVVKKTKVAIAIAAVAHVLQST